MAVEDKYTNSGLETGDNRPSTLNTIGTTTVKIVAYANVLAADDDGSVYRIFADLPSNYIPINISIQNEAITGGTDYTLGLYEVKKGVVVDADVLASSVSMASVRTIDASNNLGLNAIDITAGAQSLGVLSGQAKPKTSYDIALTANTVGTVDGTIRVVGEFAH